MKTLDLFKEYESLFNEEVEGGAPDATDIAEMPQDALEPTQDEMTPEGEKVLIELLVKAFLHEPNDSDQAVAKELQLQIDEDPKHVAASIGGLVSFGSEGMKDTLDTVDV